MNMVMRKKSRNVTITDSNWQPVPLSTTLASKGFLEGLVGLEELHDYDLENLPAGFSRYKNKRKRTLSSGSTEEGDSSDSDSSCIPERDIGDSDSSCIPERDIGDSDSGCVEETSLKGTKESLQKKKVKKKRKKNIFVESPKEETDSCSLDGMDAWNYLFVPSPVLKGLKDQHFTAPTAIQSLSLPPAIRDRMDIVGAAETGSGKTLAFAIPLLHGLLKDSSSSDKSPHLSALILTPTRELAVQIKKHIEAAAKYTELKVAVVVGGLAQEKQIRVLKKQPDIVVATPGRLWELLQEGHSYFGNLANIKYLVIDETDRMVEKGHFMELTQIVELLNESPVLHKRQTFVFSATLTLTHQLPARFRLSKKKRMLKNADKLSSMLEFFGVKPHHKLLDLSRSVGTVESLTEARINCNSNKEKDYYLYYFLKKYPGRTLVFCNSIDCVRRLNTLFALLQCQPFPLHASMQQRQRLKNLERFSSNTYGLLLATDVAARGLDIPNIQHVIHYQVPRTSESYIHRSGRTARAQKEGVSVMFIDPTEGTSYQKLITTLNKETDLPLFPVENDVMRNIKRLVNLARDIDHMEYLCNKKSANNRWYKKAAKEMEVDLDEDLISDEDEFEESQQKKKIKQKKSTLAELLNDSLVKKTQLTKYPTQLGQIPEVQEKTAMEAVKIEKKNNISILKKITKKSVRKNKKRKK